MKKYGSGHYIWIDPMLVVSGKTFEVFWAEGQPQVVEASTVEGTTVNNRVIDLSCGQVIIK